MGAKKITRYLLRLDDACPTWDAVRWERVLALADECGIRPILGVLPDNRDPDLVRGAADADFWPRMRELAAQGATIALHGYRHLAAYKGGGLLPLHVWTEFAGAPLATQQAWITQGLHLLRAQGLAPELWIAPCHGQDRNTLRALRASGITALSDGLASVPYRRGGIVWVPQQLWTPMEKGSGLWTILLHPNTATDQEIEALGNFLRAHREEFLSFPFALEMFPPAPYTPLLALREQCSLLRIRVARARKRLRVARLS